jgi:hypothetical protein
VPVRPVSRLIVVGSGEGINGWVKRSSPFQGFLYKWYVYDIDHAVNGIVKEPLLIHSTVDTGPWSLERRQMARVGDVGVNNVE